MTIYRFLVAVLVLGVSSVAQADDPIKIKAVRFDDFMRRSLAVSIPLSIPVPAEYEAAELPKAGIGQYYWMRPSDVAEANRTSDLPSGNGYMYGKVSPDVAYDKDKNLFVGVEDQASLQRMKAAFQVSLERLHAGAHEVLLGTFMEPRSQKRAYFMYVATNIETNVVYVAFRPPANSQEIGDFVWEALRRSVKGSDLNP